MSRQVLPRVKVCGIGSRADLLSAVAAGADAVGFVEAPGSPRAGETTTHG